MQDKGADLSMQLSDNTVPGNYQQPIRNFTGRIVSNYVEEVDFVPNTNMRIWYNNKVEDYPTHRHSCLEIAIPLSGSYTYVFEDRTIVLKEKDILFIPPDMLHKISGTREGIRFIFLFKIDFLKSFFDYSEFEELIKEPLIVNSETFPEVYNRVYARFMEISNLYFFYSSTVKETPIFSHLLGIIGMLQKRENPDSMSLPDSDKQREIYIKLRSLLEWLSLHYAESVTMEEAANYIGYSKFHFARIFKEYTGMTFYDYQTTLKLKSVVEKLSDTDLSISEIALSSGFNNLTSLSRNFEKHYGCSPSQYRQRIRRLKRS